MGLRILEFERVSHVHTPRTDEKLSNLSRTVYTLTNVEGVADPKG